MRLEFELMSQSLSGRSQNTMLKTAMLDPGKEVRKVSVKAPFPK